MFWKQAEAVAPHQTLNQIQLKKKDLDMLPVPTLVGIPFAWFTQDCAKKRFNTGGASLRRTQSVLLHYHRLMPPSPAKQLSAVDMGWSDTVPGGQK